MACLGAEVASLAIHKSDLDNREYTQIGRDVERLNDQLTKILLPLKTHLSKEKTKDGPFDLTGDLADGKRIVDAILDFQNLYEETYPREGKYRERKTFTIKDLDLEKLGAVTKEKLTEILSDLDNLETNHKTKMQDSTQSLFLKVNMSLAIFNCLHEIQKSQTQNQERLSQASRVT